MQYFLNVHPLHFEFKLIALLPKNIFDCTIYTIITTNFKISLK